MPRPPEMMMRALVSSGRSDFDELRADKVRQPRGAGRRDRLDRALPPVASAGGKAVPRTVMTLTGSVDCTVASALPA